MGFLSKLLGYKNTQKAKKVPKDIERRQQPISELAEAILRGSFSCGTAMKPYLTAPTQEETAVLHRAVCYEFFFFFVHVMNRYALAILGKKGRSRLQVQIAPMIGVPIIVAFYGHLPRELQEKLGDELFDNLNTTELEYSTCSHTLPPSLESFLEQALGESEGLPITSIFSKLLRRIYVCSGRSLSDDAAMLVFELSTKYFVDIKYEELMRKVQNVL